MLCLKSPELITPSAVGLHLSGDVCTLNILAIFIYAAICPATPTFSTARPGEGQESPEHRKSTPSCHTAHGSPAAGPAPVMRIPNLGCWLPWQSQDCLQHRGTRPEGGGLPALCPASWLHVCDQLRMHNSALRQSCL